MKCNGDSAEDDRTVGISHVEKCILVHICPRLCIIDISYFSKEKI